MRLEHKVLIFLIILTQKSDDRDLLTCEKFNFFSLNERTLRRHDRLSIVKVGAEEWAFVVVVVMNK